MATTTVRLTTEDAELLDAIADEYGGRSNALRAGLRVLASAVARRKALDELITNWEAEVGAVDAHEVDAMAARYDL